MATSSYRLALNWSSVPSGKGLLFPYWLNKSPMIHWGSVNDVLFYEPSNCSGQRMGYPDCSYLDPGFTPREGMEGRKECPLNQSHMK